MQNSNIAFRSIPELISEAREKHPSAVALSHGGRTVSYDQLDNDATRFASHLLAGGLPVSATVAICMERSIDWIVAALGIMRAGAAYVPLDPGWPEARILFALNDSAASVLVARSNLLERLGTQTFGIDPLRDRSAIAAASTTKIPSVSPEDLAYVIYTSGSSGVPKGVEISHANLAHLVRWHQKAFSVTPRERASHLAGLGFDAAVWEIWPNLCAGAALYLPTDEERSSAALMQQWLIREQINIAFVPTIHAAPMMGFKWPPSTSLRLLLTGGDVLSTNPPLNLPFRVINNYGPTECTVVATSTVLQPGSVGIPPIGKPIYGADIYLLDENGQRAADGTVAEIYIGGDGVGRSYRNLPEETKARFLADPFSDKPSARMYRTGDRGIRWPDGEIEFRGRLDRQIKIRGQRVELDEIASSLMNHPGVAFATVTTSTTNTGDIILLAYVLPTAETPALSRLELQEFLLETMPDYMVPAAFVRLEEVPVSINGKLDLSNLPQPSIANQLERVISKGIATPFEDRLLRIVRELLENESITAQENFFLAGGHSLLGMQLVMRITNALDVDLTLRQLFEAPTAASLAVTVGKLLDEKRLTAIWTELLRQKSIDPGQTFFDLGATQALMPSLQKRIASEFGQRIPVEQLIESPTIHGQVELIRGFSEKRPTLPSGVVALQPHGTRDNIFWVHYLSVSLAKVVGEDQPFLSVMLTSEDFPRLGTSPTLAEIAACLVDKVLATQPEGPYTLGGFCLGGILAYEMASQLRASGHNVALLILLDTPNPSFLDSRYPLTPRMTDAAYLMKRVGQLGIRKSLLKVRSRILGGLKSSTPQTEPAIAQEMIETAASLYSPGKYEGDVLLLLASDRPAHVDFLPGWRAVVPNTLHAHYIDAHHDDLTKALNVRSVADAIRSYVLMSAETPPPAESPVSAQEDSEVIDSPITS